MAYSCRESPILETILNPAGHNHSKCQERSLTTGPAMWMWLRIRRCGDDRGIMLDNEALNDYDSRVGLRSELAVSFSRIREHRKTPSSGNTKKYRLSLN